MRNRPDPSRNISQNAEQLEGLAGAPILRWVTISRPQWALPRQLSRDSEDKAVRNRDVGIPQHPAI